jgi:hypothetical protein
VLTVYRARDFEAADACVNHWSQPPSRQLSS